MKRTPDEYMLCKEDYWRSMRKFEEAARVKRRVAVLIAEKDYGGSVQAAQHAVELAVKSLYNLVGLRPPHKHDPGKNMGRVVKRSKRVFPVREDNEYGSINALFERISFLSHIMERLHTEGMYGYGNAVPSDRSN